MWDVYLKRSWIFLTICCVLMLPLIIFTPPLLKLLGETSDLAVLTGVLTLLLGLLGYMVFHWCPQICSKRVTVPISIAASSADEVADDPCPPHTNYEVFISFRGVDTRDNFTSHLYDELRRKNIKTFIDNRLNRGEEISSTLLETIEESEIYLIIFSKDYASSAWCLDELVKILECKERYGRLVIPVFYNVDPSNVRRQTGSYADSFVKHKKRFRNNMEKVHKWKAALAQAANFSGLDSTKIRPDPELIGKIVKDVLWKLKRNSSCDLEGLVGIDNHISVVESFLNIGSQDVRIVGIWGMGGIGKTTIADAIFYKLQAQFESCSLVLNVQEKISRFGLDHVRDKYLKELLEEENIGVYSFRSLFVKKLLQQKKILLVLDDVTKSMQIEDLIRKRDWFGPGSRIIITTRDMEVLRTANVDETYPVKEMSFNDALKLFCIKAFKQELPIKDYVELSKEAVNYCKCIPLALIVLGSFLGGRTKQEWDSALKRLEKAPHKDIFDVLRLSFDGLDDDQKEIFLDIALFHEGNHKREVKELLVSCGFFADIGISVLIDRSLISIRDDLVVMHDLIKAMGREIVCQPNVYQSGKGRRLWKDEDIYHVLKKNKGTEEIYGISLDLSKIKEINLRSEAFEDMDNLKILKFYNPSWIEGHSSRLHILDGLGNLPEELRFVQWVGYPHKSVPLSICAKNIVKLDMPYSHVEQLWDGDQRLPNLKTIDLHGSKHLIGIPDLSMVPNIRDIYLYDCTSLSQVYSSGSLLYFESLGVENCDALKTINLGGNNVHRRSWRLLAVNEFFISDRFRFSKASMRMFKSDSGNTYSFRFNFVSVPPTVTGICESMDTDSAVLTLVHGTLKSVLPNLKLLRLLDKPSSLGTLSKLLEETSYMSVSDHALKVTVMLCTCPDLVETTESLCSPCMKGTGIKEVVSSWEDLIDADDDLTEHNSSICNYRLSKIPNNMIPWSCLTQVSLQRSDIVTLPATVHSPSSLNSLLLYNYTRHQCEVEFTISLDSEIPENVSLVNFTLAEQQLNLDHGLFINILGNGWNKEFISGHLSSLIAPILAIHLELYVV